MNAKFHIVHTSKKHNWNVLYLWRLELRILFQLSCSWCKIVCKKLMSPILQNLQIERFSHDAITSFERKMPLKVFRQEDKLSSCFQTFLSLSSSHVEENLLKPIWFRDELRWGWGALLCVSKYTCFVFIRIGCCRSISSLNVF